MDSHDSVSDQSLSKAKERKQRSKRSKKKRTEKFEESNSSQNDDHCQASLLRPALEQTVDVLERVQEQLSDASGSGPSSSSSATESEEVSNESGQRRKLSPPAAGRSRSHEKMEALVAAAKSGALELIEGCSQQSMFEVFKRIVRLEDRLEQIQSQSMGKMEEMFDKMGEMRSQIMGKLEEIQSQVRSNEHSIEEQKGLATDGLLIAEGTLKELECCQSALKSDFAALMKHWICPQYIPKRCQCRPICFCTQCEKYRPTLRSHQAQVSQRQLHSDTSTGFHQAEVERSVTNFVCDQQQQQQQQHSNNQKWLVAASSVEGHIDPESCSKEESTCIEDEFHHRSILKMSAVSSTWLSDQDLKVAVGGTQVICSTNDNVSVSATAEELDKSQSQAGFGAVVGENEKTLLTAASDSVTDDQDTEFIIENEYGDPCAPTAASLLQGRKVDLPYTDCSRTTLFPMGGDIDEDSKVDGTQRVCSTADIVGVTAKELEASQGQPGFGAVVGENDANLLSTATNTVADADGKDQHVVSFDVDKNISAGKFAPTATPLLQQRNVDLSGYYDLYTPYAVWMSRNKNFSKRPDGGAASIARKTTIIEQCNLNDQFMIFPLLTGDQAFSYPTSKSLLGRLCYLLAMAVPSIAECSLVVSKCETKLCDYDGIVRIASDPITKCNHLLAMSRQVENEIMPAAQIQGRDANVFLARLDDGKQLNKPDVLPYAQTGIGDCLTCKLCAKRDPNNISSETESTGIDLILIFGVNQMPDLCLEELLQCWFVCMRKYNTAVSSRYSCVKDALKIQTPIAIGDRCVSREGPVTSQQTRGFDDKDNVLPCHKESARDTVEKNKLMAQIAQRIKEKLSLCHVTGYSPFNHILVKNYFLCQCRKNFLLALKQNADTLRREQQRRVHDQGQHYICNGFLQDILQCFNGEFQDGDIHYTFFGPQGTCVDVEQLIMSILYIKKYAKDYPFLNNEEQSLPWQNRHRHSSRPVTGNFMENSAGIFSSPHLRHAMGRQQAGPTSRHCSKQDEPRSATPVETSLNIDQLTKVAVNQLSLQSEEPVHQSHLQGSTEGTSVSEPEIRFDHPQEKLLDMSPTFAVSAELADVLQHEESAAQAVGADALRLSDCCHPPHTSGSVDLDDEQEERGAVDLVDYSYEELEKATRGFDSRPVDKGGCKIGAGSFADVFYARLRDADGCIQEVAVKKLKQPNRGKKSHRKLNEQQFPTELMALGRYRHPNIVRLIGQCKFPERCLVYEYVPGQNLALLLAKDSRNVPEWPVRIRVLCNVASAVKHLHTAHTPGLVHRDVKTANILLSAKLKGILGDFGLSLLTEDANPLASFSVSTAAGTRSYMAPEAFKGKVSPRVDVFAFGVVIYEVVTGLPSYSSSRKEDLATYMRELERQGGSLMSMLDPRTPWPHNLADRLFKLAGECTDYDSHSRPSMATVLATLEMLYRGCSYSA